MQQVADWLEKLGLGQYAQRFAENDIGFSILPDLTDQDLKDIGVSLGHRRQLLREIANLDKTTAGSPAVPSPIAPPIATPPVVRQPEPTGERRHVTVVFCDLVDSTGIAAKLDAEEWRDLVGSYVDAASTAIEEMGGKVFSQMPTREKLAYADYAVDTSGTLEETLRRTDELWADLRARAGLA